MKLAPDSSASSSTFSTTVLVSTSLLGLKKSCTGIVETPHISGMARRRGLCRMRIAPPPAPCVYSPEEPRSYFALSAKTTIPILFLTSPPLATQSKVLCIASTAPMHANVMSTTSQFLKQSSPNLDEYLCSSISMMYVAVGLAPSKADSVPR